MKTGGIAVVVIGRNEGSRLLACIRSALACELVALAVYVDSGSTDDSVASATELGCVVLSLDMATPFTAARARNEGFDRALAIAPELMFVQFVDGDCEFAPSWIGIAISFLSSAPDVAAVCGRRRERYPTRSIYNAMCDQEWNTSVGKVKACGGDSLMRVKAFVQADGFRTSLIAGEEPELCLRLRRLGWSIWRLDTAMTKHDAAMFKFSQWWNRSRRAGHAYAEGAHLHGGKAERHCVTELKRIFLWATIIPTLSLTLSIVNAWFLFLFLLYPLQVFRIASRRNILKLFSWKYAYFLTLGKFPEAQGAAKYFVNRLRHRASSLIEYK